MEPRYNEVLATMKITLLYQVSHYIRVKKTKKYKELGPAKSPCYKRVSHYIRVKKQRNVKNWDQQNYLVILRGFCYISDLFITRFHCNSLTS